MAEESTDSPRPLAEISHGPSAFEAFLDRNQKGLVVGAILLALVGAGVIVYRGLAQQKVEEAGAALGKASIPQEFQEVIQKYGDSPVAGSAKILLAQAQSKQGDPEAAVETLRSFIAANPQHPAVSSAKASMATRLVQQNKAADAEPIFRELADDSKAKYLAPYALIALGDIAKAAGKLDEAEASYKRVQETFGPPFENIANNHRRLVRFKMPAEIEPPAPVPTPAAPGAGIPPINPGELPNITSPDAILPGAVTPGAGNPMEDILKSGNPVPPAPPEEDPNPQTPPPPPPSQPAPPPVEQAPPP